MENSIRMQRPIRSSIFPSLHVTCWRTPLPLSARLSQDIGYPRSVVWSDGTIVTVYAFQSPGQIDCGIEATVWDPGEP